MQMLAVPGETWECPCRVGPAWKEFLHRTHAKGGEVQVATKLLPWEQLTLPV